MNPGIPIKSTASDRGSPSVAPGPAVSGPPEKCKFVGPTPDLLSQNPGAGPSPALCISKSLPEASDAREPWQ